MSNVELCVGMWAADQDVCSAEVLGQCIEWLSTMPGIMWVHQSGTSVVMNLIEP